jgi:hypothetical protein
VRQSNRMSQIMVWVVAPLLVLAAPRLALAKEPADCFACHNNPDFGTYTPSGDALSLNVDRGQYLISVHKKEACTACHANYHGGEYGGQMQAVEIAPDRLRLVAKLPRHDKVAVLRCMECHEKEATQYAESIHGRQALSGNKDAPDCVTCHGSHYILAVGDLESSTSNANVPATCSRCHENATLMARYNVQTDTVETFSESFHGKKLALGSERVAVCTSCHSTHAIFAPTDPRSSVYPAKRAKTCGACHKGGGKWFSQDFTHTPPTRAASPIPYWVGRIYILIIYLIIGAMALYVVLDFTRTVTDRIRGRDAHGG